MNNEDFIAVFETFTDYEKLYNFCKENNILLLKSKIPENNSYNNNLKYISKNFILKDKLLNEFSDYKIIHDIHDPFIYYIKNKDKVEVFYNYPKDRLILEKNNY